MIACDQDGRPTISLSTNGKTMRCAYSIERYLGLRVSAFDAKEPTHLLYQAIARWAGISSDFESSDPCVEVASIRHAMGGYLVLTNHSRKQVEVIISSARQLGDVKGIRPHEGRAGLRFSDRQIRVDLEGLEGAVLEWRS